MLQYISSHSLKMLTNNENSFLGKIIANIKMARPNRHAMHFYMYICTSLYTSLCRVTHQNEVGMYQSIVLDVSNMQKSYFWYPCLVGYLIRHYTSLHIIIWTNFCNRRHFRSTKKFMRMYLYVNIFRSVQNYFTQKLYKNSVNENNQLRYILIY